MCMFNLHCLIISNYFPAVPCSMPPNPMNGMVSCSLEDDGVLSYEDTCTTMCNTGYEIQAGDAMRTCQSDEMFNGTSATCGRGLQHVMFTVFWSKSFLHSYLSNAP